MSRSPIRTNQTRRATRHQKAPEARAVSRQIVARPATPLAQRSLSASQAQRAKLVGAACVVCENTNGLTAVHLDPRAQGCDAPECVVPMCWAHSRAYGAGRLDLLNRLEPRWRAEIAHAVAHMGLITTYRRLSGGALPSQQESTAN